MSVDRFFSALKTKELTHHKWEDVRRVEREGQLMVHKCTCDKPDAGFMLKFMAGNFAHCMAGALFICCFAVAWLPYAPFARPGQDLWRICMGCGSPVAVWKRSRKSWFLVSKVAGSEGVFLFVPVELEETTGPDGTVAFLPKVIGTREKK